MPIRTLLMPCSTTGLVATVVALIISQLPFFVIVEMELQVDEARFATLCLLERAYMNVSKPDFAAAEKLWRDELANHKCNPNRDWLHANCSTKLADVISLRTNQFGKPQAAELEHLYKTAAISFENLHTSFEAAYAYEALGDFYLSHHRNKDAEYFYKKSIEKYNSKFAKFGFNAQGVATSLVDLYLGEKRYDDAVALLTEEYQAIKARNADCPTAVSMVRFELGKIYYHMGRYAEAEALFKETLALGCPCLPHLTSYIAAVEEKLGHYEAAEREYKNVVKYERLNVERKVFPGGSSWNLASALEALATFYVALKRHDEAVPLLQEAFTIRQNEFGLTGVLQSDDLKLNALKSVADRLASAYNQQGRPALAKEVLKVAARYKN
ncbi:MAG: hypothetical protein C0507_08055 [Cyanobacteria bacterium PR.3.49]|nr:hypothetical protein [Cyanobacteria bacterium PR.3.49]